MSVICFFLALPGGRARAQARLDVSTISIQTDRSRSDSCARPDFFEMECQEGFGQGRTPPFASSCEELLNSEEAGGHDRASPFVSMPICSFDRRTFFEIGFSHHHQRMRFFPSSELTALPFPFLLIRVPRLTRALRSDFPGRRVSEEHCYLKSGHSVKP